MKTNRLFVLLIICSLISCKQHIETIEMIPTSNFKTELNGKSIDLFTLKNDNGMTVQITNYGARVVALWVPDKYGSFQDVVWGYNTIEDYFDTTDIYCGPIVGRFGNRINKGKFTLNDSIYQLTINNNENHLHGGTNGFHSKVWDAKLISIDDNEALELTCFSKDGEEGYPGNLTLTVTYMVTKENELKLMYSATTDALTVINPTNHSYFNLSGTSKHTILDHVLRINAQEFTPTDEGLIPTGEFRDVAGTPLDFNKPIAIGDRIDENNEQLIFGKGYDHNFVIDKELGSYEEVAQVYSPKSGIAMSVISDQPGLQFYSGNFMMGDSTGKRGDIHSFRTGFALETQNFPDAPNHNNFPSSILLPDETYKQTTSYSFSTIK